MTKPVLLHAFFFSTCNWVLHRLYLCSASEDSTTGNLKKGKNVTTRATFLRHPDSPRVRGVKQILGGKNISWQNLNIVPQRDCRHIHQFLTKSPKSRTHAPPWCAVSSSHVNRDNGKSLTSRGCNHKDADYKPLKLVTSIINKNPLIVCRYLLPSMDRAGFYCTLLCEAVHVNFFACAEKLSRCAGRQLLVPKHFNHTLFLHEIPILYSTCICHWAHLNISICKILG